MQVWPHMHIVYVKMHTSVLGILVAMKAAALLWSTEMEVFKYFVCGYLQEQHPKIAVNDTVQWVMFKLEFCCFSAYALAIFTEYTAWAAFVVVPVPITTHIPSFINVAHTELWIFDFFVISQSEQICKWGIKYAHSVMTDHVGSICAPTTHIPSLTKISHCVLIRERRFTFWCWRDLTYIHPSVHTYIQTALQMKTKWSFQHSWRPTKMGRKITTLTSCASNNTTCHYSCCLHCGVIIARWIWWYILRLINTVCIALWIIFPTIAKSIQIISDLLKDKTIYNTSNVLITVGWIYLSWL